MTPTKTCRKCSTTSQTDEAKCPSCGAKYKRRSVFKVLVWTTILGLVVIVGCSALLAGSAEEDPTVAKKGGGTAKVASVGDRLTLKGTTYKVTKASTAKAVGGEYNRVKANGVFVLVKMSLTNEKSEPATILEDAIRLIGGNGKNYSTSDDALFAVDDGSFILEEIQPDVTERGTLVYDIPKNAVKGAKIEVKDLFSDSTGSIRLGL